MQEKFCNMRRSKTCYILFAISLFFFLSSVFTFAVLAVTKELPTSKTKIEQIDNQTPDTEQRTIIKRLKRIEERMKKRNKK